MGIFPAVSISRKCNFHNDEKSFIEILKTSGVKMS